MHKTIGTINPDVQSVVVWDPLVRLIHWLLAVTILLNSTIVEDESKLHEWIGYIAVERIVGSYFNVMGLPVQRVYHELKSFIGYQTKQV